MTDVAMETGRRSQDETALADVESRSLRTTLGLLDGVEGWLSDDQARRLWDRAAELGSGAHIVEIGSFRGRSTIVLATASRPGTTVHAIDPHAGNDRGPQEIEGFAEASQSDHLTFLANLDRAGVADRVDYVRLPSSDAFGTIDAPIDLLYIDGAHRFGPAFDDIRRWRELLREGEALLIHDAFNAVGVTLAQVALLSASGRFRYVGRSGSLAEYRRVRGGAGTRLRNVVAHLKELPYAARNQLVKVMIVGGLGRFTGILGNPPGRWPY
jgi:predicted O-methyltransferase YrrM